VPRLWGCRDRSAGRARGAKGLGALVEVGEIGEDRAAAEAAVAKRTVAILGVAFGCDANGGAPAQVIVDERSSGLARIGAAVMTN